MTAEIASADAERPDAVAAPADADVTTVVAAKPPRDLFQWTLAIAALIHVMLLMPVAAPGLFAALVPVPLQPAQPKPEPHQLGDKNGVPDGVNVETIDAEEFAKKLQSLKPGHDDTDIDAPPAPQTPPTKQQQQQQQQKPAEQQQQQQPAQPQPQKQAAAPKPPTEKPPPMPPGQGLSPDEVAALTSAPFWAQISPQSQDAAHQPSMRATAKTSQARAGFEDEYGRSVIRALINNKPFTLGHQGQMVVRFGLDTAGGLTFIQVMRSSGKHELDDIIVANLKRTKFPPQTGAETKPRAFVITYEIE